MASPADSALMLFGDLKTTSPVVVSAIPAVVLRCKRVFCGHLLTKGPGRITISQAVKRLATCPPTAGAWATSSCLMQAHKSQAAEEELSSEKWAQQVEDLCPRKSQEVDRSCTSTRRAAAYEHDNSRCEDKDTSNQERFKARPNKPEAVLHFLLA